MFFHKGFKLDKETIMNMRPTSKASLKQMCLLAANGDLDKAQKLYEYMAKDMDDLPLFDAVQPSTMQQIKNGVSETFGWIAQNQDDILVFADMLKSFFSKKNGGSNGMPPSAAQVVSSAPLPNIN